MKDIADEYFNVVMKKPVPEPKDYATTYLNVKLTTE